MKSKLLVILFSIMVTPLFLFLASASEAGEITNSGEIDNLRRTHSWCPDTGANILSCLAAPNHVGIGEASSMPRDCCIYRVPVKWNPVRGATYYIVRTVSPIGTRYFKTRGTCIELPKIVNHKTGVDISVAAVGPYRVSRFSPVTGFRTCSNCRPIDVIR